ncbi:hypothetical protein ACFX2K_026735 [Malus domestica]
MCVNLCASWQGRLANMPNLYSHSRKQSPNLESQIPQTTFSKCSDRVKTCETGSSHYRAMTKQGKGIALLLVVRETPIYVDLHPQRTGRPAKMLNPSSYLRGHSQQSLSKYSAFFPPDNTSANKLY